MTDSLSNDKKLEVTNSASTLRLLVGLWKHLRRFRRVQGVLLLVLMLLSGIVEAASLGAVLPFLSILSSPETVWGIPVVQSIAKSIGIQDYNQLLLPATVLFAGSAVAAAAIRMLNLFLNCSLVANVGSELSCEAYKRTLYQPYLVQIQRNSSVVINNITTQVDRTIAAMNSFMQIITSAIVSSCLIMGLLVINTSVALLTTAIFGIAYAALASTARNELRANGLKITVDSKLQLKALQEGLGAIRDVLLDGSQSIYCETYRRTDITQRQLIAKNIFLGAFPRYALESLGIVVIAFLGYFLSIRLGTVESVIPLLGALAVGAQRLLPALQQTYSGWTSLRSYNSALEGVLDMLNQPILNTDADIDPLNFKSKINLNNVFFKYSQSSPEILHGLSLEIRKGERIGLIGTTGSGKSTTVDLLMGLLAPTSGTMLVDGVDLHHDSDPAHLRRWMKSIAHVPQSIYLSDASFAENIAFGVSKQDIDMNRVKSAARKAQISQYIESLDQGYTQRVGERGISLSGGQKQRIGIARALYKNCQLLILDEATSALDSDTERAIMESIAALDINLTIVMIAHRLSTLENCDRVITIGS